MTPSLDKKADSASSPDVPVRVLGGLCILFALFGLFSVFSAGKELPPFSQLSGFELLFSIVLHVNAYFGRWFLGVLGYPGTALLLGLAAVGLGLMGRLKGRRTARAVRLSLFLFVNALLLGGLVQGWWNLDIRVSGALGSALVTSLGHVLNAPLLAALVCLLWIWFFVNLFGLNLVQAASKGFRSLKGGVAGSDVRVVKEEPARNDVEAEAFDDREEEKETIPQTTSSVWKTCTANLAKRFSYRTPPLDTLKAASAQDAGEDESSLEQQKEKLERTLQDLNIDAHVEKAGVGPMVIRYDVSLGKGVKIRTLASAMDELSLGIGAHPLRFVGVLAGTNLVGIEVPKARPSTVLLRNALEPLMAKDNRDGLDVPLGVTTDGAPKVWDISKMPHLLIAGATGSGKSVFVHSLITSLLFQYTPDELRMVFVDPKAVELTIYDGIPHLLHPAVTASERAQEAVDWLCDEMERRYGMLSKAKVRNIQSYHNKARKKDSGGNALYSPHRG